MFDFNFECTGKDRMTRKPRHPQSRWANDTRARFEFGSIRGVACESAKASVHFQIVNENYLHLQSKFFTLQSNRVVSTGGRLQSLRHYRAFLSSLPHELALERPASRVRSEAAKPVAWGGGKLLQPAHWSVVFSSPGVSFQAEYWLGNRSVSVKRSDNNVFATLNNLHKGTGAGIGWVLLADTLAGSIILLSLSGVVLWALINRRRVVGASIGLISLALAVTLAMLAM